MALKKLNILCVLYISFFGLLEAKIPVLSELLSDFLGEDPLSYFPDSKLNFTELTGKYGYRSEEHTIVTEDGYVLTAFRILRAKNCHEEKRSPPVLLMHGLLQSSDSWIDSGPGAGLAYLVADACYDLWLGNVRGTYYSRRHLRLNPDKDAAFWHFSVDEIGFYDVPALVDYVIKQTGSKKINYIGFSQGGGTFYIMCSERPAYCDKVQLAIGLSPATRHINTASPFFRLLTTAMEDLKGLRKILDLQEVLPKGGLIQKSAEAFCQLGELPANICALVIDIINSKDRLHVGSITAETAMTLLGHFPAGTSAHNLARYGQAMRNKEFIKYNYGAEKNLELYGSVKPPQYNLSAVTAPVVIIYGRNDGIVDIKDVEFVLEKLPQVLEAYLVKDPVWNHLDVTYSQYTSKMIFPKINEYLLKYSHT